MNYKTILFASDLTDNSERVGKRARALADHYHATLDIVHVIEFSPMPYSSEFPMPFDLYIGQHVESYAHTTLTKQAHALKIASDRQHLLTGHVKSTVLTLAKKTNTDLILIGAHGPQGLSALLGSRANSILQGATCDVLAVRC